jgi:hypothetical protein
VEIGEMFSELNRKMGKKLPIHDHENRPKSISESKNCAIQNAKEHMAKLIKVMVKDLAQRTTVVSATSLLSIYSV